jgi:hypothetical protein
MDALKNLHANIPSWVKRLDDLAAEIEQRQRRLAEVNESQGPRSLRNKGSTESLLKKDDDDPIISKASVSSPVAPILSSPVELVRDATFTPTLQKPEITPPPSASDQPPSSPGGDSHTPSALKRQTNQVMAVAQAKARATVRKRQRSNSVVSAEGAQSKYRTRSMIIVYYDSYVQSFFEELVKFVSASRNLMRKAKMAAKVAQIKRMAELEMPDEDDEDDDKAAGDDTKDLPPALRFTSTRTFARTTGLLGGGRFARPGARTGMGGDAAPPDVYDDLDKCLEDVQSQCERAAHQFLRDGDCGDEIETVQRRLGDSKTLADREMERVQKEDPEALNAPTEQPPRSFRRQTMRREAAPGSPTATGKIAAADAALEVDEGIDDMEADDPPKLVYKSTRMMR